MPTEKISDEEKEKRAKLFKEFDDAKAKIDPNWYAGPGEKNSKRINLWVSERLYNDIEVLKLFQDSKSINEAVVDYLNEHLLLETYLDDDFREMKKLYLKMLERKGNSTK